MSFRPEERQKRIRKCTTELVLHTKDFVNAHRKTGEYWESRVCPVCGNSKPAVEIDTGVLVYVRCPVCRLLYQNPVIKQDVFDSGDFRFKEIFEAYWTIVLKTDMDLSQKPDPERTPILQDIWPHKKNGLFLDVGCSVGSFLRKASFFFDVEGLEINPQTRDVARRKGIKVHSEFLPDIAAKSKECYDVITFNQLLYCLRQPMAEYTAAQRLLKKGGILYINTPNADSAAMSFFKGEHCHVTGPHNMSVFSPDTVRYISRMIGFEIVYLETEFVDIYISDILIKLFFPESFVHRDNCFIPFYKELCKIEDRVHKNIFPNTFVKKGDYIKAVLRKA